MREEFEKWYLGRFTRKPMADGYESGIAREAWQAATALQAEEIERLSQCLAKANAQTEHFEREWYLRGDEIERQAERVRELEEALQAVLECGSTSDQWWVDKARKALSATAREVGK